MPGRERPAGHGRDETPDERSDRNWNELLQELRVMQTGVQILTGFLLTLPFQSRFAELDAVQVRIYLVLVVLAVLTTVVVVAPVSLHRQLFGRHLKPRTVTAGDRTAKAALVLLGAVVTGTVLLVFDVVVGRTSGVVAASALAVVVVLGWGVLPRVVAVRHGREDS